MPSWRVCRSRRAAASLESDKPGGRCWSLLPAAAPACSAPHMQPGTAQPETARYAARIAALGRHKLRMKMNMKTKMTRYIRSSCYYWPPTAEDLDIGGTSRRIFPAVNTRSIRNHPNEVAGTNPSDDSLNGGRQPNPTHRSHLARNSRHRI